MIGIYVALALGISAQISDDGQTNLQNQVTALVKQLDAADRATRDNAEKELLELGEDILTMLPSIDPSTPAEVKDRLTRVRNTLEKQAASQSAEASRLTVQGTKTLGEFFQLVQEQTQNELVDYRSQLGQQDSSLKVDLDFNDTPFFEALDQVLDQAGLSVYNFGGEQRKLALISKPANEAPRAKNASYAGPFRIEPTEIFAQRNLRNPGNQNLRMRVEILWEPRIVPVVIRQPLNNITIVGSNDGEISLASNRESFEIPVQSTVSGIDLILPMSLPDRSVSKLKSVKGTFYAMVPGREVTFRFKKLANARNIIQKKAGVTVILDRVRKNRSLYELRVKLRLDDAADSLQSQSHLEWASNNVVYLESKDGRKIDNPNFERYSEQEIGFAYLFPLGDDDISNYELVYKTPAAIIQMPVEYELKDIELP